LPIFTKLFLTPENTYNILIRWRKTMKNLIVYYSLNGANERVAMKLKEIINCDAEKIIEPINRHGFIMFIRSGYEAIMKKITKIKPLNNEIKNFDRIILVSPVWAGRLPPPTRTFLVEYKPDLKDLAFVSVSGNGDGNKNILSDIEEIHGKKLDNYMLLTEKESRTSSYIGRLKEFAESSLK
jgi:multimeric flavodoxin WrbA